MNWMEALLKTYDSCIGDPKTLEESIPLVPIFHTTNLAQVEVTLDSNGNFVGAEAIPKEMQTTIIPCTEGSSNRTSAPDPHPLCDKLVYLIPDIQSYAKETKKSFVRSHEMFMEQLNAWCESDHANAFVKPVYEYLRKGTLFDDLINSGILVLNDKGKLADKEHPEKSLLYEISKINGEQSDAFVRWTVISEGKPVRLWAEQSVRESWTSFVGSQQPLSEGLCYLTGDIVPIAEKHPSRIRYAGDKAKLVSSNQRGFYFGKFDEPSQVCGIGFESTQKIHSALRWLIGRQGCRIGDLCMVSWTIQGDQIGSPIDDPCDFLELEESVQAYTGVESARHLNSRIRGYNSRILNTKVMIMSIDSATPGRMSIMMFREELGEDFVKSLEDWHTRCAWIHNYPTRKVDGKTKHVTFIGAPAPKDIAEAAYGMKADQAIISGAVARMIPSILDGQRIPKDIVNNVVHRASNPVAMEPWEWGKTLSIACSVYKESKGGMYEMVLENERKSRDYLFGRLLAVADLLESAALREAGENRQTTAIRLMQRFSEFPYSTWKDIELALIPYASRLGSKSHYYESKISEIMELFEGDDFRDNRKLSGEFLLAYHCQKADQFKKKDDRTIKEE